MVDWFCLVMDWFCLVMSRCCVMGWSSVVRGSFVMGWCCMVGGNLVMGRGNNLSVVRSSLVMDRSRSVVRSDLLMVDGVGLLERGHLLVRRSRLGLVLSWLLGGLGVLRVDLLESLEVGHTVMAGVDHMSDWSVGLVLDMGDMRVLSVVADRSLVCRGVMGLHRLVGHDRD